MTEHRPDPAESGRVEFEVEVPGTPEEVWEAIATGPGISAWFMPADVDETTVTFRHGPEMSSEGAITAAEKPHRFAFDEGEYGATEFLVEARSGGTCVVRVVTDFADAGADEGWTSALQGLRIYLEHFAGRYASGIVAGGMVSGPNARAWAALLDALGVAEPEVGARFEARNGPPLAGVVEHRTATTATLLLESPAPGIGFVGVGGPDEQEVYSFVRAQLFGEDREAIAARDEPGWRELLSPAGRAV